MRCATANWCPAFRPATIRSSSRAPRSICRPGAPAGWRARCSSTQLKGDAAILPRIVALGDLDEDEIAFAEAATGELAEAALALPPAFAPLERRLLLAELILKWANAPAVRGAQGSPLIANTPSAALGARRRPRPPDGRHDHAPGAVGQARRPGAGRSRSTIGSTRSTSSRSRATPGRHCAHERGAIEAGRAPRQTDRGRGQAPRRQRRAGDRRRLHRLDAGDRQAARHHRQAAARRGGAARPRHGSRRRRLGADRRQRRRQDA